MDLRFENAWILFLLWIIPLLLAAVLSSFRARERRLSLFVSSMMQKKLRPASGSRRRIWQAALLSAGVLLCMVALARPQWGRTEQRVFKKGRDIVIALDVSRSMLANDVHPNRLERAKIDIMDLISELSGDRTALIAFRRKAVPLCPLTTDYSFLRHILDMTGIHSAPVGETDIGDAIAKAVEMLSEDDSSHKAVLLISDGEDLTGRAIDEAEKAAAKGIPVFTVGFGRSAGSAIPDPETGIKLQYKGQEVVSKLDNDTLYRIARASGGAYVPIQTASTADTTLGSIYRDHFSKIAAREIEESISSNYSERFHYFLLPGILLLLGGSFLSSGRLTAISQKPAEPPGISAGRHKSRPVKDINPAAAGLKDIAVLITALLLPALACASTNEAGSANPEKHMPEGRRAARKAQSLHRAGRHAEAAAMFLRAASTVTGPSREAFVYNAAASLFSAGRYGESRDLLKSISGEGSIPLDRLDSALGTAHYRASENPSSSNEVQILKDRLDNMKASAEFFAEAARLDRHQSEQALRNAGIAMKALPALRETAKHAQLMAEHAGTEAFQLLDTMLGNQRSIITNTFNAYMDNDPGQVYRLERLADEQERNADLWIPLREKMAAAASSGTNNISVPGLEKISDELYASMMNSAEAMRNLDTAGYHQSAAAEQGVYSLWKGAAPFASLLDEDIRRQSNALYNAVNEHDTSANQDEALSLTELFSRRFSEAFPAEVEPGNNKEDLSQQMTPEKREQILDLASLAAKQQKDAVEAIGSKSSDYARNRQQAAMASLNDIRNLLPKDSRQENTQEERPEQDKKQEQDPAQGQQDKAAPEMQQPEQGEGRQEKEPDRNEGRREEDAREEDVQRILEKALQREKEHETELRRRENFISPKMIDRDW